MDNYFHKLADLGFMVVCRRNQLGTTSMFAVRESDCLCRLDSFDEVLMRLPEWRVVDFRDSDAATGAELLYQKLTCTGIYSDWDERIGDDLELQIGMKHRPASECFPAN